jgi:hypothetical protein
MIYLHEFCLALEPIIMLCNQQKILHRHKLIYSNNQPDKNDLSWKKWVSSGTQDFSLI